MDSKRLDIMIREGERALTLLIRRANMMISLAQDGINGSDNLIANAAAVEMLADKLDELSRSMSYLRAKIDTYKLMEEL